METRTPILNLKERLFNIIDASIPNKAQNNAIKGLVASAIGDCIEHLNSNVCSDTNRKASRPAVHQLQPSDPSTPNL